MRDSFLTLFLLSHLNKTQFNVENETQLKKDESQTLKQCTHKDQVILESALLQLGVKSCTILFSTQNETQSTDDSQLGINLEEDCLLASHSKLCLASTAHVSF